MVIARNTYRKVPFKNQYHFSRLRTSRVAFRRRVDRVNFRSSSEKFCLRHPNRSRGSNRAVGRAKRKERAKVFISKSGFLGGEITAGGINNEKRGNNRGRSGITNACGLRVNEGTREREYLADFIGPTHAHVPRGVSNTVAYH